ncbi:MAG TPA: arabinofuranosidase catalytic domain-containing protein [Coleofasciculaceae cyanobacterium]
MVVNSSARNYRIRVQIPGGSSLDVSQACTGDSSGYLVLNESEPDEQGICTITGKLVLDVQDRYLDGNDFPQWSDNGQSGRDVFSPDLNPTRWAIGNFIRIEVANDAGTLVPFTRDYLRVLKIPAPPYAGNQRLELDIGDDLTLLNWRSPDGDGSEVSRGTATAVGSIVRSILRRATFDNGTNADVDTVTMDGTLNYNTPKSGGSWVDQAGRLAFTAGYILWQNKDQEIIAQPIDLDPGSAFLTATLGEDEIDFKMIQGSEKPASVVRAAGVGQEIEDRVESGSTEVLEYAVRASVPNLDADGAVTNSNDSSPLLIRKTTVDWGWDGDYLIRTDTTNIYEARGVAVSDQFYFDLGMSKPTSPYTLIQAEQIIEKSYYGGYSTPQEGFLIRKERDVYQVSGKALGDYYKGLFQRSGQLPTQTLNMLHVESSDTRYSYVGTQTRKIETKTLSRIGRIAGASTDWANTELTIPNGFDWVVGGTALQEWEEVNPDEWRYTDQEASAGTESGSIAVMLAVVTTRLEINSSTSGQYDPPAAETRPPRYTQTEKELSGTAEFEPTEGEDYAPRERTYQVDHVISDAQCERIAETLGALLYGRHLSLEVTLPFTPTWLSYEPLSRIDVINGSIKYAGLTSGVTWVLAANRAIVTATLLKLGVVDVETDAIRRPYRTPRKITATQGQGADITLSANLNGIVQGFDTATGTFTYVGILTSEAVTGSDTATATFTYAIALTGGLIAGTDTATGTFTYTGVLTEGIVLGSDTASATFAYSGDLTRTVLGTDTASGTFTYAGVVTGGIVLGSDTASGTFTYAGQITREYVPGTDTATAEFSYSGVLTVTEVKLLDSIGNAPYLAYSLRKLRDAYSGAAIRVQRSSDNTQQDIGFTSAGDLDVSVLATFIGSSNGLIVTWYDQSGNGRNATVPSGSVSPRIATSGTIESFGSRYAIDFNITNAALEFTQSTSIISWDIVLISDVSSASYPWIFGDNTTFHYHGNTGTTLFDTSSMLAAVSNASIYQNGVLTATGSLTKPTARTQLFGTNTGNSTIRYLSRDRSFGRNWQGSIAEVILWTASASADRTTVQTNTNTYYSL